MNAAMSETGGEKLISTLYKNMHSSIYEDKNQFAVDKKSVSKINFDNAIMILENNFSLKPTVSWGATELTAKHEFKLKKILGTSKNIP